MENVIEFSREENKLLTPQQVAAWLCVSQQWVMDHTSRYKPIIPHRRFGRKIRFCSVDVQRFIDAQYSDQPIWKAA